jgi:hypothetical protein
LFLFLVDEYIMNNFLADSSICFRENQLASELMSLYLISKYLEAVSERSLGDSR